MQGWFCVIAGVLLIAFGWVDRVIRRRRRRIEREEMLAREKTAQARGASQPPSPHGPTSREGFLGLGKCKECGSIVSTKAKTCPSCGAPAGGQVGCARGCLAGVVLLAIGAVCAGILNMGESSTKDDWQSKDNSITAYSQVEEFVKNELKSPSTASFPGLYERGDHTKYLGRHQYHIVSWVDAQNGFGGIIRNDFVADVEQVSATEWKCNSLEITPR